MKLLKPVWLGVEGVCEARYSWKCGRGDVWSGLEGCLLFLGWLIHRMCCRVPFNTLEVIGSNTSDLVVIDAC